VVIVVNKWDQAKDATDDKGRKVTTERYEEYFRKELGGLRFSPISFMSAKEGLNLKGTLDLALELHEQANTRVGTGKLNRIVKGLLEARGPSNRLGQEAKVYFASQVKTAPPTLVLVVNDPDLFTNNYERFMMNRLREVLPFDEVPIRLILRARKRVERRLRGTSGKGNLFEPDPETGKFESELDIEHIDRDALLVDLPDDAALYFDD
jgi:GTP-binding protein